jgi:hypothetical protein
MPSKNEYDIILRTFKELEDFKICCKVSILECINSKYINKLTSCMKVCLESIEAVDVCQYFIASKSKNTVQCIAFVVSVLKNCIKECNKASYDSHLKKINRDTTAKAATVFMNSLLKIKKSL